MVLGRLTLWFCADSANLHLIVLNLTLSA